MVRIEPDPAVRAYVRQYQQIAKLQCAPLFWNDSEGKPHNGSMTFVRANSRVLGITNKQVAEAIEYFTPDSGITLQLGGARFDPGLLIAKHPDLDLASYDISSVLLGTSQHDAASIIHWPIAAPSSEDVLVIGGWPAIYRKSIAGETIDFSFAWVAARINGPPGRNISVELLLDAGTALSNDSIASGANLGGWSGGPVYRYVDTGTIEYPQLCGIIYSSDEGSHVALAHALTSLNEDGTFDPNR